MRCKTTWALAIVPVLLSSGLGCVSCREKAYYEATHPEVDPGVPPLQRAQTYLFMMNGFDVLELGGILSLRDRLCEQGFAKVYYAQRQDVKWYYRELRRIRFDQPDARFVLLGYGTAADRVVCLARDAVRDQIAIDSVVLLDPAGVGGDLVETLPVHSVLVRSHNWAGGTSLTTSETIVADRAGHYALPTHSATVAAVTTALTAAAARVTLDDIKRYPHFPLADRVTPTPRAAGLMAVVLPPPQWDILRPGQLPDAAQPLVTGPSPVPPASTPLPGPRLLPDGPSQPLPGPPLIPTR